MNYVHDVRMINQSDYPKVINFTAKWCGPCKSIAPELEELAKITPSVYFFKVDIDEHQEYAHDMKINSVPTFHFYRDILSEPVIIKGANIRKLKELILH